MQYPKMLYKGDQENYQTVIADDEDHESELVEQGWREYGEWPEWEQGMLNPHDATKDSSNPFAELEEENAQLKEVIEKVSAENKGLQDQVGELQDLVQKAFVESVDFQDQIAALNASIQNPESITSNSEPKVISLNDLTLAQLQEMAESKGIAFKVRDSKGTLIELLMDYQDKELANADSN